jgi:hypothetical protein
MSADFSSSEYAFWRFEGGKPVIASVYYMTVMTHNKVSLIREAEDITDCTIVDCRRRTDATVLGVRGDMVNHLQSHKDWATSGDLGKMAYFFNSIGDQRSSEYRGIIRLMYSVFSRMEAVNGMPQTGAAMANQMIRSGSHG